MKKYNVASMVIFIFLTAPFAGRAASPSFIPLQGFLEDAGGAPVNGDVNIHFAIYDAETGGTALWYETQNVLVEEGLLSVYLGEVEAIDLGMFRDNTNLWLSVQVEADLEMDRVYLGSTPFAGYAEYCGNIPDHGHDFSQITETDAVVAGAQSCPGNDKVVGIDMSGALICAADENTIYLAGSGLVLTGATFSVDTTQVQARISESCAAGSSIRVINADGTVACENNADMIDGLHAGDLQAEIDSDIAAHRAIADAHHSRYTDGEVLVVVASGRCPSGFQWQYGYCMENTLQYAAGSTPRQIIRTCHGRGLVLCPAFIVHVDDYVETGLGNSNGGDFNNPTLWLNTGLAGWGGTGLYGNLAIQYNGSGNQSSYVGIDATGDWYYSCCAR